VFTTRKHPFSGRKKRPKSNENGRKIKKMAKITGGHDRPQNRAPVTLTGGHVRRKLRVRSDTPAMHLPAATAAANSPFYF
jgi:hypothetical protein